MKSRIERFEDLIAWRQARALASDVYRLTCEGPITRDFALRNQLRSAVVSIAANIAEGFERNRPREFHQFLSIAKASCAEVRTYLYIATDIGYFAPEQQGPLMAAAEEVAKVIGGLRSSVEKRMRSQLSTQHSALSTSSPCS